MSLRAAELVAETLRLRPRLDGPTLAAAWRTVDPRGLPALADYERGQVWLLRRLRATGADRVAPAPLMERLAVWARDAAARALLVDGETAQTLELLGAAGVECVLLKGAARRAAAGRWPCVDARSTTDVDLLVPAADAERAWQCIQAAGYRAASSTNPSYHLPALVGPGQVAVELHTSLNATLPPADAWARLTRGAITLEWQGRQVRIPSATELFWHGLTHAGPGRPEAWRLRYFLDGAAPLAGDDPLDWESVAFRLDANEVPDPRAARRWLGAAAELAGVAVPTSVLRGESAFDVTRALRWRLAVLARRPDAGLGARLLEEGTRVELGLAAADVVRDTGPIKQTRRRLGGRAARGIYRLWRATRSRP